MNKKILPICSLVLCIGCLVGTLMNSKFNSGSSLKPVSKNDYIKSEDGSYLYLDYYVSQTGSDNNSGTKEKPLKSIDGAFKSIKKNINQIDSHNSDASKTPIKTINILLEGGDYYFSDNNPLKIDGSFCPSSDVQINVKPVNDEVVTFNGGMKVENWETASLNGKQVLKAFVGQNLNDVYSLSVNNQNAEIANSMSKKDFDSCNLSNQNRHKHCYIDEEGSFSWGYLNSSRHGEGVRVKTNSNIIKNLVSPNQAQMVWLIEWKEFLCKIDSISSDGTEIKSNYFDIVTSEHDLDTAGQLYWPDPIHNFYIQNDISLIDRAGEFCYDKKTGYIYYYPLNGQTANNIDAYIPRATQLIDFETTMKIGPIKNINFENINFAHTKTNFIDLYGGFGITQGQTFTVGKATGTVGNMSPVRGTMDSTMKFTFCRNVNFTNCVFKNLGLTAIEFAAGCQNCHVTGCRFTDLGNCALVVSTPNSVNATPASLVKDIYIENNVIRRVAKINYSAPAILVYYTENTEILHNDIYDGSYTGISMGWGWAYNATSVACNNVIAFNKIGNFLTKLKDGGTIYTLGQQPLSRIEYNYLYSQHNNFALIYLDEGTAGYTVQNNVVFAEGLIDDEGKYLKNDDGEDWEHFAKECSDMHWLNLNDLTGKAGTSESPMRDIQVVNNYYCCSTGYGKTNAHPDNIIPPMVNDNPSLRNIELSSYESFFSNSNVKSILSMSGLDQEYEFLLDLVKNGK